MMKRMSVSTMRMSTVQYAKAFPKRPESTSARICEVMILMPGVVRNTMGDSVVIDRANANVRPVRSADWMRGSVTLRNVVPEPAPSEVDAYSMAGWIWLSAAIPAR